MKLASGQGLVESLGAIEATLAVDACTSRIGGDAHISHCRCETPMIRGTKRRSAFKCQRK